MSYEQLISMLVGAGLSCLIMFYVIKWCHGQAERREVEIDHALDSYVSDILSEIKVLEDLLSDTPLDSDRISLTSRIRSLKNKLRTRSKV